MAERADDGPEDGDRGPIGIFPSWGWLYAAVVVYTAALIGLLWLFTRLFDFGSAAP